MSEIAHLGTPSGAFAQDFRRNPNRTNPFITLPLALDTTDPKASNELRSSLCHGLLSAVLGLASTDVTTFISDNRTYVALFTLIYILSNNLVDCNTMGYDLVYSDGEGPLRPHTIERLIKAKKGPFYELFCNLDLIFATVPGKHLEGLLHSRLASVRAAFETLIMLSGLYEQPRAFHVLVKVGAAYGWLDVSRNSQQLLILAVSMNQISTLQTLLNSGCRPDSLPCRLLSFSPTTAIVKAMGFQNYACAQLLLKHCDTNKAIGSYMLYAKRDFEYIVGSRAPWDWGDPDASRKLFEYGLGLFFQAGTDPDSHAPVFEEHSLGHLKSVVLIRRRWSNQTCPTELKISVLDYLFYFHRSIFHKILSRSAQVQDGRLSRTGILLALDGGNLNLEAYLHNLDGKIDRNLSETLLRQVIAEQFLICDFQANKRSTNMKTVQALTRVVSIDDVLDDFPHLLEDFTKLVPADCHRHEVEAASYLLKNGAAVNGEVLSWFAQLSDQGLFDIERVNIRHMTDLDTALINAATQNNFEAVQRLLHTGVNLDGDVDQGTHGRISIVANIIASWNLSWRLGAGQLSDMLDFLVKRGAPLRLSATRAHLYHLLCFAMSVFRNRRPRQDLIAVVHYIVSAGYEPRDQSFPSALLLESCDGLLDAHNVFEYLLRNGAQLRPGSPMATWIGMCGEIELVREMLEAGVDINAYNHGSDVDNGTLRRMTALQMAAMDWRVDVMELLLQAGADVNAPAKHAHGRTALQASCDDQATSSDKQQLKLKTVQLLLDHGADVNAAPARTAGITALQAAAKWGDLAVAKLLLFHRPVADVNAPPCQQAFFPKVLGTALDLAADNGRIDMVQLLLNCNGLSHSRCETGFDGAIRLAQSKGHFAVAELIRKYVEDTKVSDTASENLSRTPRDWREYGYELDSDDESELSENDRLFRNYMDSDDDSNSSSPSETGPEDDSDSTSSFEIDQEDSSVTVDGVSPYGDSEYSEEDTGSIVSSNPDQQNSFRDASDLDIYSPPQHPAAGELSMGTANNSNIWASQEDLSPAHEGDSTAARVLPFSLQDVGFEDSMDLDASMDIDTFMDYDMSFDSEIRQSAFVQDASPPEFEHEAPDDSTYFSQPKRLVEEVFGDCE